jgi:hypothetical protein
VRAFRRLFSFPVALACLLALLAVLTARGRFDDPDLWWHLKMGQVIWTTHSIPTHDLFSYTTHHQALVPQEWLAELSIYGAYLGGGYTGLMLWLCVLAATVPVIAYALCWLYSGNAKVAFAGGMIVWFFATIGYSIRPQLLAYSLLLIELLLIHVGHTRNPRWFFVLPFLFLIWINCHGSFILGMVVACVCLACSFVKIEAGSLVSHRWPVKTRRMFVWAIAVSAVALLANPAGIRQILYPFDTLTNMPLNLANVEEWAPLQLTEARGIGLLVILLCCFLLAITRKADLRLDELVLLILGAWLAMNHTRMLIVFGIFAAPILSRQLANSWDHYLPEKDRVLPNILVILITFSVLWMAFPSRANLEAQVEAHNPTKALAYMRTNHLPGPILNDYGFGGYLIWAASDYPVMIDGRADVYEWSGFLSEYANWALQQNDPNLLLDKYDVNLCLLSTQSRMLQVLPLMRKWKKVYADNNAIIFVRTAAPAN